MRNLLAVLLLVSTHGVAAQEVSRPLVQVGEVLTYQVHSARFGNIGSAVMRVEADTLRGKAAYRLSFDFKAKVMLLSVSDRTRSWLEVATLNTMRFTKAERSPIGQRNESADVMAELGVWIADDVKHKLASADPLDELAFIYYVRGMPLTAGASTVERHFDAARNPVRFQVTGQQDVTALGGVHSATVVEMAVRDPRQKTGRGMLRFYLGNDSARLPLRIDSEMPVAGALRLTLQSVTNSQPMANR